MAEQQPHAPHEPGATEIVERWCTEHREQIPDDVGAALYTLGVGRC